MRKVTFRLTVGLCAVLWAGSAAAAQRTQASPATDSSVQSSPIQSTPHVRADDSSQQASPIRADSGQALSIAPHTAIKVKLLRAIDSGRLKNGETVEASLMDPVALSKGMLPANTMVELTVVETMPAGRISAAGEFSLQVERVGSVGVYTDTLTYRGEAGHKDLPDSAPAVGTNAALAAGAELTFHSLPQPEAASGPPGSSKAGPGSVNGVASGATRRRP